MPAEQSPVSRWKRPWTCFPLEDARYNCTLEENVTWAEWKQQSEGKLAIAYRCVAQSRDDDDEPYDVTCKPVPSRSANRFEDGTVPRFHCFGTYDESDAETEPFSCSPYWALTTEVRKKRGSGWFLWLALQENDRRQEGLMAVARRLERVEREDLIRELRQPTPSPEPPVGKEEIDAIVQEADAQMKASDAVRKALSDEDIQREIAASEAAWREGRPLWNR